MAQALAGSREESTRRGMDWPLIGAVFVLLTFSAFWVTLLSGPAEVVVKATVEADAQNAKLRAVYFPAYFLILMFAALRWKGVLSSFLRSPALAALIAVPFLSVLWSIDPSVTLRKSVALALTLLLGVALFDMLGWRRLLLAYALAYGVTTVLSLAYGLFLPAYGRMWIEIPGAWRGVWSHKNLLGLHMALGAVIFLNALIALPRWRALFSLLFVTAVALLILSQSKTALGSLVIGLGVMALVGLMRRGPVSAMTALFLVAALAVILGVIALAAPDLGFALLGKDASLTGRTKIWAAVLRQISERPLTGFGFGAVWTNPDPWSPIGQISRDQGFLVTEAHNAWLQIALDLGLIGVFSLAAFEGSLAAGLVLRRRDPALYLIAPFLVIHLITSLTEADAMNQNDWNWALMAAIAARLAAPSHHPPLRSLWRR